MIRNTDSITASSVTRRSGGYPIVVQCVLSAENQSKQVNQLIKPKRAIRSFFDTNTIQEEHVQWNLPSLVLLFANGKLA